MPARALFSPPRSNSGRAGDTLGLDDFCLRGALGTGGTSQVLLVQRKGMAGCFAMKVIPKAGLETSQIACVVNENQLLQTVSHPYLVRLQSAFQDTAHFYLILDYFGGGDLAMHLVEHGCLDEAGARVVIGGAVLALRHLHEVHAYLYRDLKPENILLSHRDGLPVLADFGTVKAMSSVASHGPSASTHTYIGTPLYMAPEQWHVGMAGYGGGYGFSVDWWATGVLLYEVLLGDTPWGEGGVAQLSSRSNTEVSASGESSGEQSSLASAAEMRSGRRSSDGVGGASSSGTASSCGSNNATASYTSFASTPLDVISAAESAAAFQLAELPDDLTPEACSLIRGLLKMNPLQRLGCGDGGGQTVSDHAFFASLDWNALLRRELPSTLYSRTANRSGEPAESASADSSGMSPIFSDLRSEKRREAEAAFSTVDYVGSSTSPRGQLLRSSAMRHSTCNASSIRSFEVQRERGVSCGWFASGGANGYFDVTTFRGRTDLTNSAGVYDEELKAARSVVDRGARRPEPVEFASAFYSVYSSYCAICEDLLSAQERMLGGGGAGDSGGLTQSFLSISTPHDQGDAVCRSMCLFSRLKESVGRQRAFLCGALALPEASIPAFSTRAFADLVVSVHQQRAYEEALEESAPPALLCLIRPGLVKPPELALIQRTLESDFDVMAVRAKLTPQRCWELHTEHIDTLRRLEILLSNEVLRSSESLSRQREQATHALRTAASAIVTGSSADAELVFERLASLPSHVIKAELAHTLDLLRNAATTTTNNNAGSSTSAGGTSASAGMSGGSSGGLLAERNARKQQFQTGKIPLEELQLEKRIGEGVAGTTYRARYRSTQVAVKVAGVGVGGFSHWRHELAVLTHIAHPNIVRYFGAVESPPTYCLVLEYCQCGDLRSALGHPTTAGFFWRVAVGVASGMLCLHAHGMMHRDLKSPNILLDRDGVAKLTDFGLTIPEQGRASPRDVQAEAGTFRWMAPEVARRLGFRPKSDVYSYGMVLFELLTHELPFADVAALHAVAIVAVHGGRPPLPTDAPPTVTSLIARCWSEDTEARPTFEEVEALLLTIRDNLGEEEELWLDEPNGHRVYSEQAQ